MTSTWSLNKNWQPGEWFKVVWYDKNGDRFYINCDGEHVYLSADAIDGPMDLNNNGYTGYNDDENISIQIPSNLILPICVIFIALILLILALTIWNSYQCTNKIRTRKIMSYHVASQNSDTDII